MFVGRMKNYDAEVVERLYTGSLPPPVGGLNYRDELAAMDPRDALVMDNVFPQTSYAEIRKGFSEHCDTGESATIETLMQWSGLTGNKLKAAVNGKIYDVTTSTPSSQVTGLSENQWQWTNFATAGGNFLVAANGTDAVRNYDGSNWTSPSISNVTSATLINVCGHKSRLWFVEKDTQNAWYLPVNSVAGAAVKQFLGPQFPLGGKLVSIGSLSHDAGDGPDDYLAFISDKGDVAVYQGTDPSVANQWAIVGRYRIGVPVGYRHLMDIGGDLVVLTTTGVESLISMMKKDQSVASGAAVSNKIQNLLSDYLRRYGTNEGWMVNTYPRGNWAIINVPFSATQYNQLIMNTLTGAWCQFVNMNGFCWSLLGDDIYFGSTNGTVYLADDDAYQDDGGVITAYLTQAWTNQTARGRQKLVTLVRPIIKTNGAPSVLFIVNTDFQDVAPTGTISASAPAATLWGSALWGSGVWGGDSVVVTNWVSPQALGEWTSIRMTITTNRASFILNSYGVTMQRGGVF